MAPAGKLYSHEPRDLSSQPCAERLLASCIATSLEISRVNLVPSAQDHIVIIIIIIIIIIVVVVVVVV
eukprot:2680030-Pyramimonas_sp.AAC.1